MSISSHTQFLQRLQELHGYVRLMGDHVNQIYNRLDEIERNIDEMKNEHKAYIETNKDKLGNVKGIMVVKSKVNNLFRELDASIKGPFPSLPVTTLKEPSREEELSPEKEDEMEKKEKEDNKERVPFFSRFWTTE